MQNKNLKKKCQSADSEAMRFVWKIINATNSYVGFTQNSDSDSKTQRLFVKKA